jgi:hypothetical protein
MLETAKSKHEPINHSHDQVPVQLGLENYTFLTSEMALARHNVHAGRKRQFWGGISNVH